MTPAPSRVHIHYHRPPDRTEIFTQELILDAEDVKITLARDVPFDPPIRIRGQVALEKGADALWFTFPGRWHDIGRFHRADGTFTGIYANILTPAVIREDGRWDTDDLFLDLWLDPEGELMVLDEEELEEALRLGWIDEGLGRRAREEADRIVREHARGRWPPTVVEEWTLERARQAL